MRKNLLIILYGLFHSFIWIKFIYIHITIVRIFIVLARILHKHLCLYGYIRNREKISREFSRGHYGERWNAPHLLWRGLSIHKLAARNLLLI